MRERTLQGALTFLGFALSVIAVFYFAVEYIPRVSPWTQVAALILLGLAFALLGVYLRGTSVGQPFFSGPRLQWLRPPVVLYLLAIFSGIVAEIRFLSIDGVPKPVKILISLAIGIGLIVVVAQRASRRGSGAAPPGEAQDDAPEPAGPANPAAPSRPATADRPKATERRSAEPRRSAASTKPKKAAKR
jgi:hypothetical protein